MEEALQTPEIVNLICDSIVGANDKLAFTLTRKLFLEPGLDALWSNLTSFRPLLSCLPNDLYESKTQPSAHTSEKELTVVSFRRTFDPEYLNRYRTYYAPRIRHFKPELSTIFSTKAMKALRRAAQKTGALSPRIKRLSWFLRDSLEEHLGLPHAVKLMSFAQSFLNPETIESIAFEIFPSDAPVHKFSHCPSAEYWSNVKEVEIQTMGDSESRDNLDEQLSFLCWAPFETVRVSFITVDALAYLATLPQLTTLGVSVVHVPTFVGPRQVVRNDMTDRPFPSLREVEITSSTAEDIIGFLRHLPLASELRRLKILTFEASPLEEFQGAIAAIQERCNVLTLRALVWHQLFGPYDEPRDVDIREVLDITPLLGFVSLEWLALCFKTVIDVTPVLLAQIPTAWPKLHSLDLCGSYQNTRIPTITHTDVLTLLRGCPALELLGLSFDTTAILGPEVEVHGIFPQLQDLTVGSSPIYSPSRVFKFIKAHFPKLRMLFVCREGIESMTQQRWEDVRLEWMEDRWRTNSDN